MEREEIMKLVSSVSTAKFFNVPKGSAHHKQLMEVVNAISIKFENARSAKYLFDVNREDLYIHNEPKERTKKRLVEIAECGMSEVGVAEFGYKGIMSGLYIEKVWGLSDDDFKSYMDWAKSLINEKKGRV